MTREAGKPLVSHCSWSGLFNFQPNDLSVLLQLMLIDSILTYLLDPSFIIFLCGVIQGDYCAVVHSCPCLGASPCACPYDYSDITLRNNNLPVGLSCSQPISTWAQDMMDSGNTLWVYIHQHPGTEGTSPTSSPVSLGSIRTSEVT